MFLALETLADTTTEKAIAEPLGFVPAEMRDLTRMTRRDIRFQGLRRTLTAMGKEAASLMQERWRILKKGQHVGLGEKRSGWSLLGFAQTACPSDDLGHLTRGYTTGEECCSLCLRERPVPQQAVVSFGESSTLMSIRMHQVTFPPPVSVRSPTSSSSS